MLAHGAYTYYIKKEHPCSVGTTVPAREIRRPPRVGISLVCNSEIHRYYARGNQRHLPQWLMSAKGIRAHAATGRLR